MFALVGVIDSIIPIKSTKLDYTYYELIVMRNVGKRVTKNLFVAYRKEIAEKTETLLLGDRVEISFVVYGDDYKGKIENKLFVSNYTLLKRKQVKKDN